MKLSKFVKQFRPDASNVKPSDELIQKYRGKLPGSLLELWKETGLGKYGDGILLILNPDEYKDILTSYFGDNEDDKRIPIAISAFGMLYYFKDAGFNFSLGTHVKYVAGINPHKREAFVYKKGLGDSMVDFFNNYLCTKEIMNAELKANLFNEAISVKGPLGRDEIFCCNSSPQQEYELSLDSIDKGNARMYLKLLFHA